MRKSDLTTRNGVHAFDWGVRDRCDGSHNHLDERRLSCSVLSEQRNAVRRAHAEVDSCEEVFAVGVVEANATQHNSRLIKGTASLESGSKVDHRRKHMSVKIKR
jgi:hypothetical protein